MAKKQNDKPATTTPTPAPEKNGKRKRKAPKSEAPKPKENPGSKKDHNDEHVKRSKNGWIHFRSMFNLKLKKPEDAKMAPFEWQQEVTKAASKAWGALTEAEKKPYNDAAAVEAEEHKIKNPGYKYRPKPRKNTAGSKQRKRDDAEVRPKESGHRKKKARRTPLDDGLQHPLPLSLPSSSSLASPRAPAPVLTPHIGRPDVLDQFNVPPSAGYQYMGTMRGPVPSHPRPRLTSTHEFELPQAFTLPALAFPGPLISRPAPLGIATGGSSTYQDSYHSFRTLPRMPSGWSQQSMSDQFTLSNEFEGVAFESHFESHSQQAAGCIQLPPIPWPTPSFHGFPAHGSSPAEFTIPDVNEQVPSCLAIPLVGDNSEAAQFVGLDSHAPFEFGHGRYFEYTFEDIRHW